MHNDCIDFKEIHFTQNKNNSQDFSRSPQYERAIQILNIGYLISAYFLWAYLSAILGTNHERLCECTYLYAIASDWASEVNGFACLSRSCIRCGVMRKSHVRVVVYVYGGLYTREYAIKEPNHIHTLGRDFQRSSALGFFFGIAELAKQTKQTKSKHECSKRERKTSKRTQKTRTHQPTMNEMVKQIFFIS